MQEEGSSGNDQQVNVIETAVSEVITFSFDTGKPSPYTHRQPKDGYELKTREE